METVFDHNITKEEIVGVFGYEGFKREWIEELGVDQIGCYADIYRLYRMRGDQKKAEEYLAKIPDSEWKMFTLAASCLV